MTLHTCNAEIYIEGIYTHPMTGCAFSRFAQNAVTSKTLCICTAVPVRTWTETAAWLLQHRRMLAQP